MVLATGTVGKSWAKKRGWWWCKICKKNVKMKLCRQHWLACSINSMRRTTTSPALTQEGGACIYWITDCATSTLRVEPVHPQTLERILHHWNVYESGKHFIRLFIKLQSHLPDRMARENRIFRAKIRGHDNKYCRYWKCSMQLFLSELIINPCYLAPFGSIN